MNKFERAYRVPMSDETIEEIARKFNITSDDVRRHNQESESDEIWKNDTYQVAKRRIKSNDPTFPDSIHLSIKRLDKEPVHDWREIQKIKNELVGEEIEMWECYPKESLLVDTANQYHLWGCDTETKIIPWGFTEGRYVHDADEDSMKITNTKQRKL